MTDKQLLEEYSKEIYRKYYNPKENITVAKLIERHRILREKNIKWNKEYDEARKEGYQNGYNFGVKDAASNTIQFKDLRQMTIQDLANFIGTDD